MIDLRCGDCLEVLRGLPAESVHCCVTSPPYFGLRDYGTGRWEGGDPACEHKKCLRPSIGTSTLQGGKATISHQQEGFKGECPRCGARRVDGQIGLERSPDAYVAKLVEVFREVRRALRADGTLWLNMGDSYAAGRTGRADHGTGDPSSRLGRMRDGLPGGTIMGPIHHRPAPDGLKPKDLLGIPWRVAFALQADGWYLRSDIIWHKPNPMPESVRDRPTKAHEYLFLLAKSERYFYDAEAISEPSIHAGEIRATSPQGFARQAAGIGIVGTGNARVGSVVHIKPTRNRRSVWTVTPRPFKEAHFATFPPQLVEPCILAGSPEGGTVLDPFSGAGTTGLVAAQKGRSYIGIELNPSYVEMSRRRIAAAMDGVLIA